MNKSLNLANAEAMLQAISHNSIPDGDEFKRLGGEGLIAKLTALGVPLTLLAGGGYTLKSTAEPLDEKQISSDIRADIANQLVLHCLKITDSTNAHILRGTFPDDGYIVVTSELQTEGRGRRGREWVSPYGQHLSLSLGFRLKHLQVTGIIPLNAALAVRSALMALGYEGIGIKWPNDLYLGGRKLGGILVEAVMDRNSQKVVIGVGVNVTPDERINDEVDQPVAFLEPEPERILRERNRIAAAIIEALIESMSSPLKDLDLQRQWDKVDLCRDRLVRVITASGELSGVGGGIGTDGEFILKTPDGELRFHSGEISLRLQQ
jgi:BirA family biotin operon repressor/biotin-[acetyl-CoA-carboxylase] ligase